MNEQKDLIKRFSEGKLSRRDFIKLAVASGASVAGITGVLSACAPEPTAAPEPPAPAPTKAPDAPAPAPEEPAPMQLSGELSMKLRAAFIPQGNEVLKAIVEDWGAKNGVKVNVDIVSMNDLQTITATAAETGAGPDIVEINQGSAHLYSAAFADVSDVCDDLGGRYGGWYDSAKEACVVDGKWLSVPRFYAPHAISYRTDVFEAVGVTKDNLPQTWEEVYEVGKAIMDAGLPPIAFPLAHATGDGNDFNYTVLWSYGASDVAADGKTVAIDSAETRAALEFMLKLKSVMPDDVLSYDDGSNNRAFDASTISASNNAPTIWGNAFLQQKKVEIGGEQKNLADYTDHFEYPAGPAGKVAYAEFMSQAIFSYSPNVDAAKALLTYLNEKDQLSPWAMPNLGFVFPALKDYMDNVIMPWNTNPKLAPFKTNASVSHLPGFPSQNFRGGTDAYAKWVVVDMFASVCAGIATIDEAIATAAALLAESYG
jgi:multiple sugar transport system substrate-binding protein